MGENTFVLIVYKVLEQQKHWHFILKTILKSIVNKGLRCSNKGEYVRLKKYVRIMKSPFMIYVDFESMSVPEDNGKQNPSHVRINIKNIWLAVMAMN